MSAVDRKALEGAWQRLYGAASRTWEAAAVLEDAGGLAALAATWTPGRRERAAQALRSARAVLDAQLAALGVGPPGRPRAGAVRRRRIGPG